MRSSTPSGTSSPAARSPTPTAAPPNDLRNFSPRHISRVLDAPAAAGVPHHDDQAARAQDWFVHGQTSAQQAGQWRASAHVLTTHPDTDNAFAGLGTILAEHADALDAEHPQPDANAAPDQPHTT